MGSMKQKRRKKLAKQWAEFQADYELADETMKLVRETGYSEKPFREKLSDPVFSDELPVAERIEQIHRCWRENLLARKAAIEAGLIEPRKKKKKKPKHDPEWAKAKALCRLNMDDIRKAKELGISARALIKNNPSPNQQWKAPVKIWIQDLYERRMHKSSGKSQRE